MLDFEEDNPGMNMAIDEAVLLAVEKGMIPNTVRFWKNRNAVAIGYSQKVEKEIHQAACRRSGVAIVRRFTGGGAVYQNYGNLNWTVVIRRDDYPGRSISGVSDIFQVLSRPIIQGLEMLGLRSEFKPPNGICIGGKKISGMAAYVKRESLLCHGTLLVYGDFSLMRHVLRNQKVEVTTLEEKLSERFSMKDVKDAIVKGFDTVFCIRMNRGELSNEEKALAVSLYTEKYIARRWNHMR